jgi:ABC-type sugar transport system permease subunit
MEALPMTPAVRPVNRSLRLRRLMAPALFIAPAALALILTMAAPMADAVLLSLQHWDGMTPPSWIGFSNYLNLFHDETFFRALWHTAYFTVCTVILQTILPLLIASLLNSGVRGSTAFRTLYFMPVIISLAISGLLWAMLFEPNFGAVNSFLRAVGLGGLTQLWLADAATVMPSVIIVSVWQSLGFYLVIFFAALQGVPKDLYEAAELDGANAWSRFVHVSVPTIWPVILIVIVLNTINGIKVFDQIWVMTAGGPNYASATLGTYLYAMAFGAMGASNSRLGYATAIAMVILLLSIVVSIVQIRLGRRGDLDSQIEM